MSTQCRQLSSASMQRGTGNSAGTGRRRNDRNWRRNPNGSKRNAFRTQPSLFEGPSASVHDRELLGTFCTSSERKILYGHRRPAFFKREYIPDNGEISVRWDVGAVPENVAVYDLDKRKTLHMLLRWILDNKHSIVEPRNPVRLRANIVCAQHILTVLAMTPYMEECAWTMCATKNQGTVYLSEYKTEEERKNNLRTRSVYGHRFQHYLLGGKEEEKFDPNKEFRTVMSSRLGKHSLLYSAQLVGADPDLFEDNFSSLESFIAAKTCSAVNNGTSKSYFIREKLLGIWATNTLAGIPRALVGFRRRNIVDTIRVYNIEEIPDIVENAWSPNVALNFVEKFLDHVQATVEDNPDVVYLFERPSKGPITWEKLRKTNDCAVLEDWFVSGMGHRSLGTA